MIRGRGQAYAFAVALVIWAQFSAPLPAQTIRQLTDARPDGWRSEDLSDDGTIVVAAWRADPLGTNPEHVYQVFKWEMPANVPVQLTSFEASVEDVSITDDGQWISFESVADPLELNADGSHELFIIRSDGSDLQQMTDDTLLGG